MSAAGSSQVVAGLDLRHLALFCEVALSALGEAREEIDALNVYPVPDGDTGTNMFLTFESARNAALGSLGVEARELEDGPWEELPGQLEGADPRVAMAAFARGAFLGARGNSGVILSQLVGALGKRLSAAAPGDPAGTVFAEGLALAAAAAYAAVGAPDEGTILSVAKAAANAATATAAQQPDRLGSVVRAAAAGARAALVRTTSQLQVLSDAGVVDAGGRGLCVILDAAETAVTGRRPLRVPPRLGTHSIPVPVPSGDLTAEGPAYEVMYLLDAEDEAVGALRATLSALGDSVVVVGGDGFWNVHVHVDDVGAAIEAGIGAGRPHRVRITHFTEQDSRSGSATTRTGRTVVAVAAGAGLADLFVQAGATVVPGGSGRRPTTGQLLEAILLADAAEVIVLPNDRASVAAAEAAARTARAESGLRVAVISTDAQVQGLAALAVHEPGRSFEQDLVQMSAAARHARSGAVTVAVRQAMTSAGPCEPGDVLGVIEGDFVVVGSDLLTVGTEVLERLLGGGGELVTLVRGAGGGDLAERCAAHLRALHPTVDVVVYDGGQQRYPLLVGVE